MQEAQRVPYRINPRRKISRHILIKIKKKTKHKERILKAAREKQQVTYKRNIICSTADLSADCRPEGRQDILKKQKGKTYNQDYHTQQGSPLNMKEKSKALQTSKS